MYVYFLNFKIMKNYKKLLLLLILILITSCSDKKIRCYICDANKKAKVSEFVSKNIKDANNMSDEEMEDVISQLEETGIKIHCRQEFILTDWNGNIYYDKLNKKKDETIFPYLY